MIAFYKRSGLDRPCNGGAAGISGPSSIWCNISLFMTVFFLLMQPVSGLKCSNSLIDNIKYIYEGTDVPVTRLLLAYEGIVNIDNNTLRNCSKEIIEAGGRASDITFLDFRDINDRDINDNSHNDTSPIWHTIRSIRPYAFANLASLGFPKVKYIQLGLNPIQKIEANAFQNMKLTELSFKQPTSIARGGVLYIQADAFAGLETEYLNLYNNQVFTLQA